MSLDDTDILDTHGINTDEAYAAVLKFIRKCIAADTEKETSLNFTLYQLARRQAEAPVRGFEYDFEKSDEDLTQEILEVAVTDMISGRFAAKTTYCVRLDGEKDKVNFPLEMPPRGGSSDAFRRDFHADVEGLTSQTMDQNQFLIEKIVEMSGRQEGTLLNVIDRQTRELNDYKRSEIESRKAARELMDGVAQRDMMVAEFHRDQERKDKFADGFKALGPPVAAAMLGPQVGAALAAFSQAGANGGMLAGLPGMGPPGPSDEDLIDELVLSLEQSPQKLGAMSQALGPEDVVIFVELKNRSLARREMRAREQAAAAEAARAAAQAQSPPPGSPPPGTPGNVNGPFSQQSGYYGPNNERTAQR